MKITKLQIGSETWEPTQEQIDAVVAAYEAARADPVSSNLNPPPATEREHRLADAMDASLNDVRKMVTEDGVAKATSFMDRYREKAHGMIAHAAFHEFFELAAKLNESAHALGIRQVSLNADHGDVSVTYRTRERGAATEAQG
jgi:hypothetical protein